MCPAGAVQRASSHQALLRMLSAVCVNLCARLHAAAADWVMPCAGVAQANIFMKVHARAFLHRKNDAI